MMRMPTATAQIMVTAATVFLSGCVVGPDYTPAESEVSPAWIAVHADTSAPVGEWWHQFDDPILDRLIQQALAQNLDLRIATERVTEARAVSGRIASQGQPQVSAGGSLARQRQSETGPLPAGRIPGIPTYQTAHDLGLDASWEIDLFGRIQRSVEAADARLEASVEVARDVQISVTAEVARVYFRMRGAHQQLAAAASTVADAEKTLKLVKRRHEAGSSSLMEVRKAEAELAIAQTRLAPLRALRDQAALALGVLLGELPESEFRLAESAQPVPALSPVPVGTRADILRRRPDVRRAERELAAATAQIGVAEGELYPRLALGASGGFTSLESGDMFDAASRRWTLAPFFSWRVLDGGRVRAEIDIAESRQRQAALAYERAVLRAITEAEQALSAYRQALNGVDRQSDAAAAVRNSTALTRRLHESGQVSLLALLDAQRQLNEVEGGLAQARSDAAVSLVMLYKALGGGWQANLR